MAKVIVFHSTYGCDTGCCGHIVKLGNEKKFLFEHPCGQEAIEFAVKLIQDTFGEHYIGDLDWENSVIIDD